MDDLREPTGGEDSILTATLFQPSVMIEFSRPTRGTKRCGPEEGNVPSTQIRRQRQFELTQVGVNHTGIAWGGDVSGWGPPKELRTPCGTSIQHKRDPH